MKHLPTALLFGAVAVAVAYASGAPVWGTAVAGVLVAAGVWALAYVLGHR